MAGLGDDSLGTFLLLALNDQTQLAANTPHLYVAVSAQYLSLQWQYFNKKNNLDLVAKNLPVTLKLLEKGVLFSLYHWHLFTVGLFFLISNFLAQTFYTNRNIHRDQ